MLAAVWLGERREDRPADAAVGRRSEVAEYTNTPSAIIEPLTHELTKEDEDVMERMMMAVIEAGDPQAFDRIVNGDTDMQLVLLRWRGHLTLAARAFYRMQMNAYTAAVE
jgi:hypothetical protein